MSGADTATKKRRAPPGSGTGTPSGSGARSPTGRPGTPVIGGSRASSPGALGGTEGSTTSSFPSLDEIRAAIPPAGVKITALIAMFKSRLHGDQQNANRQFIQMVKAVGRTSPTAKGFILPRE